MAGRLLRESGAQHPGLANCFECEVHGALTEYPYGAVVADAQGNVLAAAKGKSKEGLAELIRLKLLPPPEEFGEDAA